MVLREVRLRPLELQVEPAERRAAVAADVAGGVVPGRDVAPALGQHEPHKRLNPGEEDAAALPSVLVVEIDVCELDGRLVHIPSSETGGQSPVARCPPSTTMVEPVM